MAMLSSGVQQLLDALSARVAVGNVQAAIWNVVWNRDFQDATFANPVLEPKLDGVLVAARAYPDGDIGYALVDTKRELAAATLSAEIATPLVDAIGSRVELRPGRGTMWTIRIVSQIGLGLRLSFEDADDRFAQPPDRSWLQTLRETLILIRDAESQRRRLLDVRRSQIKPVEKPNSLSDIVSRAQAELRAELEAQTDYTFDERSALDRARLKQRLGGHKAREGLAEERDLVQARQKRFDALAAERLAAFRETLPHLREEYARKVREYEDHIRHISAFEQTITSSRGATERTHLIERRLDYIDRAALRIAGFALPPLMPGDRALLDEIDRTTDLLYNAIPPHRMRVIDIEVDVKNRQIREPHR